MPISATHFVAVVQTRKEGVSRYRFWAAQSLRMLSDALSSGPKEKVTRFPQPQLSRNGDEF